MTCDLERRMGQHRSKLHKGSTSKYNIYRLVYFEEFSDAYSAIAAGGHANLPALLLAAVCHATGGHANLPALLWRNVCHALSSRGKCSIHQHRYAITVRDSPFSYNLCIRRRLGTLLSSIHRAQDWAANPTGCSHVAHGLLFILVRATRRPAIGCISLNGLQGNGLG